MLSQFWILNNLSSLFRFSQFPISNAIFPFNGYHLVVLPFQNGVFMKQQNWKLSLLALLGAVSAYTLPLTASEQEADSPQLTGAWVCKTSPIWNGRTSYPRFASGATQEEAFRGAQTYCATSGQASYCESQIRCWQESDADLTSSEP